jgi:hypothetical protein
MITGGIFTLNTKFALLRGHEEGIVRFNAGKQMKELADFYVDGGFQRLVTGFVLPSLAVGAASVSKADRYACSKRSSCSRS